MASVDAAGEGLTDTQFEGVMRSTVQAKRFYRLQLRIAEMEYKRRFGYTPGELEDAAWLKTFHADNMSVAPTADLVAETVEDQMKRLGLVLSEDREGE